MDFLAATRPPGAHVCFENVCFSLSKVAPLAYQLGSYYAPLHSVFQAYASIVFKIMLK